MQTRQNVDKNVKCGHFCSNALDIAKLMINFFRISLKYRAIMFLKKCDKMYSTLDIQLLEMKNGKGLYTK